MCSFTSYEGIRRPGDRSVRDLLSLWQTSDALPPYTPWHEPRRTIMYRASVLYRDGESRHGGIGTVEYLRKE